ncbi:protein 4.2-like isoform 3-T3 [Amazona ochrocephala]
MGQGSHPSKADGTQTEFLISSLGDQKQWSAALEEQDPCFWTISVNTPANAPIGQYALLLHASKSDHLLGNFTLLFNPWCQDDEVFLANEAQRQEYVLNQDGVIYWGTENAVLAQPWDFSQFEEDIVDICFTLLDVGERHRDKDHTQRKNPVYICRIVAAMLNCDEFRGILTECGTRQYFNGTPPSKWLGSGPILRQWIASQCKPVRYGQCWVFAAVMCSVLRCLGIPTRVVTGFTWAHNTNSSLSVDEYYDEDGTLLTQDKNARVWTFHVWNECWMARADLLPEYSGWQALDATCQNKSKGPSFCGPAPVQAIKEGDTEADYDVCYFFAAINAKCQVWIQKTDHTLKPALGSTKYTGNNISTKSVDSERCEDITHNYKYPEGSFQEKVVLDKAYTKIKKLEATSSSSKTQFSFIPTALEEPVNLFIHLQLKNFLLRGQDVPLSIEVFNHSGGEKATHLLVGAQSLHYNGVPVTQLWKEEFHFTLRSNEANTLQVFVPYSQYREELGQDHLLRLTAILKDEDSFYIYLAQEEIIICDPPLTIEFPENMVQYQPSMAKIGLLNPLTEPLEKCVIVVAGRGLIYRQRKYKLGSVQPKSIQQLQIPFTPTQAGPRRLTAHLTCLQLQNLKTYKTTNIATA